MRIAIVTGASSGMGKEMVKTILKKEKNLDEIWLLARRVSILEKFEKAYKNHRFRLFPVDLNEDQQRQEFYSKLEECKPQIALFVHAAGIGVMGKIEEISSQDAEEMVELNVKSYVSMTSHVLPFMERGGRMIYFSSASAFLPQPGFAVYAASKAFVLSYVRALRAESHYKNLRITAVCPGAVKTDFFLRAAAKKEIPFYKKMVMADSTKVVALAYKDNKKGKEISVYGIFMKAFFLLTKLLPHGAFLLFMRDSSRKDQ